MQRIHFSIIDSTNSWAKAHASDLDPDVVTLVTADQQTSGRGRFNRVWVSPPAGNIYATFCLFLPSLTPQVASVAQVLALAVCELLEQLGLSPQLKWPNDVVIEGRKIGGILCETTQISSRYCLLLGLGLNVNMPEETLATIDRPATSLAKELGTTVQVEEALQTLQNLFGSSLKTFHRQGFSPFLQAFEAHLLQKPGAPVRLSDFNRMWEGVVDSLNADGSLQVRLTDGKLKIFHSGEIV